MNGELPLFLSTAKRDRGCLAWAIWRRQSISQSCWALAQVHELNGQVSHLLAGPELGAASGEVSRVTHMS